MMILLKNIPIQYIVFKNDKFRILDNIDNLKLFIHFVKFKRFIKKFI